MLIGIHGKKRTGKTTTAGIIASLLPYTDIHVMAFADKLKEICHVAFGTPYKYFHDQEFKETFIGSNGMTPRDQMKTMADALRAAYGDNFFVEVVAEQIDQVRKHGGCRVPLVVSDVREPHEAAMIRAKGGVIWHLRRDTNAVDSHKSEAGITVDDSDYVLNNTSDNIEDLRSLVRWTLNDMLAKEVV